MSDVFGGGGGGFITVDEYNADEALQQAQIDALNSYNNASLTGRIVILEQYDSNQDILNSAVAVSLSNKLNTSTFNTFTTNQTIIDSNQNNSILTKADKNYVDSTFQTISGMSNYQTVSAMSNYATNSSVTSSISSYHDLSKADKIYVDSTFYPLNTNPNNYQTLSNVSTSISLYHDNSKLDTSLASSTYYPLTNPNNFQTYNNVVSLIGTYQDNQNIINASTYQTIIGMNSYATNANLTSAINALNLPQTAANTPTTSIPGVIGTNVQDNLASLQNNINGIVVSGTGFDANTTTILGQLNQSWNGHDLPYNIIPTKLSSPSYAHWWYILSGIDQFLGRTDPVNHRIFTIGLTDIGANTLLFTINAGTGNASAGVDILKFYKNGDFIIQDNLGESFSIKGSGNTIKFKSNTTTIQCGSNPSKNLQNLISEEQLMWNAIGGNLSFLTPINQNLNTSQTPSFNGLIIPNSISLDNNGQIINYDGGINQVVNISRDGILINGYGGGVINGTVMFQINSSNNVKSSCDIDNSGNANFDGTISCKQLVNTGTSTLSGVSVTILNATSGITSPSISVGGNNLLPWYFSTEDSISLLSNSTKGNSYYNQNVMIGFNNAYNSRSNSAIPELKGYQHIGNFVGITNYIPTSSVIIGNNHNISPALTTDTGDKSTIMIGANNTIVGGFESQNTIIGYNNNCNYYSTYDLNRICIGNNNDCHGINSICVGMNNGPGLTSLSGNLATSYTFGANWNTYYATGNDNILHDNSILLGDRNKGPARIVLPDLKVYENASYLNGVNIQVAASTTIAGFTLVKNTSARRNKKDIKDIDFPIDDFMKIKSVEYRVNGADNSLESLEIGLIADDLVGIPLWQRCVRYSLDDNGNKQVQDLDYARMISGLINIVQKQQIQINNLLLKMGS